MKKFYYKKEESIDKTPIILRLERSRTLNLKEDGMNDRQSRYAARATSISSVDQLRDFPTLPRAKTREVTKSLSEDVLSKTYSAGSTVVITESDLSSSWLYKNIKAAVNSKDENESAITAESQSSGLSPVKLQDPKMKPVPVVTKGRTKTFSCCCYLALMVAIVICIIGFISIIGGIIYLEVLAKNSAKNPTSESPMDASNLLQEAQSKETGNSTELNDQRMNQDSSRSLTPIKVNESSETDDQPKTIHILDFGKTVGTELSQYIDNKRTKIRFQKGNTSMYEEKSINSIEYEEKIVAQSSDDQSDMEIGKNKSIENGKSNQSRKNLTDFDQKLDETIEIVSNQRSDLAPRSISRENVGDHSKGFFSLGKIKDNLEENKTAESTSEAIIVSMTTNKIEDSTDQEKLSEDMNTEFKEVLRNVVNGLTNLERKADRIKMEYILNEQVSQSSQAQITELEVAKDSQPSEGVHDIISDQSKDSKEMSIHDINSDQSKDSKEMSIHDINSDQSKDSKEMSIHDINSDQLKGSKEMIIHDMNFDPSKNSKEISIHDINPSKSNTDVESMLSIIDDLEIKNDQLLISKRKGNVIPGFNPAASRTTKLAIMKNGVSPSTDFSQQFQEAEKPKNVEPKSSVDIKVSLAAAMKHLQVLDVNNKLLSSRAKSAKPKVKVTTTRPPPRTNKPRKEETSREKMQYLQKLRLMIYNRLQQ